MTGLKANSFVMIEKQIRMYFRWSWVHKGEVKAGITIEAPEIHIFIWFFQFFKITYYAPIFITSFSLQSEASFNKSKDPINILFYSDWMRKFYSLQIKVMISFKVDHQHIQGLQMGDECFKANFRNNSSSILALSDHFSNLFYQLLNINLSFRHLNSYIIRELIKN